jgi:hypothetical protein
VPSRFALVLFSAWSFTQTESGTLDRAAYMIRLDEVSRGISNAATREQAGAIAASVADRWTVQGEDVVVNLDLSWLDAAVARAGEESQWPSTRREISSRLDAMRAEAVAPRVVHGRAPDAALAGVLARPEFQRSPVSRWLDAERRRVAAWIVKMLNKLSGSGLGSRAVAMRLAWIAGLLALVTLTGVLARMLTRQSRAEHLELASISPPRTAAREWGLRALRAVRAGDLREAIRCGYHGALCRLDEQGIWQVDEARTPREYLRLLHGEDPRRPAVAALTRQFEQVWYGGRVTTDDDARQLTAHLENLGCLHAADRAI